MKTKTPYGLNEVSQPRRIAGGYEREDKWTSDLTGQTTVERRFCAGPADVSDVARRHGFSEEAVGNIRYNSKCGCCFLGFSHTVEAHNQASKWTD